MAVISAQNSSDILERCLQAIERGDATIEQCVAQNPGVEGLDAMLQAASAVQRIPRPVMPLTSKQALEQRLVARMKVTKPRPQQYRAQRWLRVPLTLFAMLVVLLGTGFGLTRAAENTIPGDPLYGIKRASEQVSLAFSDEQSRPGLLTSIAESRLMEIVTLAALGRPIDDALVVDTAHSLDAASAVQPDPVKRAALYEQGQRALELVAAQSNANQTGSLSAAVYGIATQTPTLVPTPIPTATETPSASPTETPTPSDTPEGTLENTPEDTPDEATMDTPDPWGASTDAATRRGPKKTPVPRSTKDKGKGNNGNGGDNGNMGSN
jgi:Domain of unknown function (DUF5667)